MSDLQKVEQFLKAVDELSRIKASCVFAMSHFGEEATVTVAKSKGLSRYAKDDTRRFVSSKPHSPVGVVIGGDGKHEIIQFPADIVLHYLCSIEQLEEYESIFINQMNRNDISDADYEFAKRQLAAVQYALLTHPKRLTSKQPLEIESEE